MSATDNEAAYRKQVQKRLRIGGGKLTDDDHKLLLDRERRTYGLLPDEARAIVQEEERLYMQPRLETTDRATASPSEIASNSKGGATASNGESAVRTPAIAGRLESETTSKAEESSPVPSSPSAAIPSAASPEPPSPLDFQSSEPLRVLPAAHSPFTGLVLPEQDLQNKTTMLPPVSPEIYLANLQRYGQAYSQALDKGFLFDDDTKARLQQLARDLGLTRDDATKTEQDILRQRFNPGGTRVEPPNEVIVPEVLPETDIVPPPPIPEDYKKRLNNLKKYLNNRRQWKQADEVTLDIILSLLYHGKGEKAEELDPAVLVNFSAEPWQQEVMQEVDRYWQAKGKFGFQRQLQIYHELIHSPDSESPLDLSVEEAVEFAKRVLWWKAPLPGFGFLRFYDRLNFTPQAAAGHLPAWWFWKTTKWNNLKLGGLYLLPQRGGCRMDVELLAAFMSFLMKCGFTARPASASKMTEGNDADPDS